MSLEGSHGAKLTRLIGVFLYFEKILANVKHLGRSAPEMGIRRPTIQGRHGSGHLAFADTYAGVMTATELLGEVLARARSMVGRSPEQVGDQTGVHGRTIRRLEDGESTRPRRTTLQTLAAFYGLDGEYLSLLARWSAEGSHGETLERLVFTQARAQLGEDFLDGLNEEEDGASLVAVAMRLARRGARSSPVKGAQSPSSAHAGSEPEELTRLVEALKGLDRRRRRAAAAVIIELRRAQIAEYALRRQGLLKARGDDAASDPKG